MNQFFYNMAKTYSALKQFYLCLTTKFSQRTAAENKSNSYPKTPQSVEDSLNENAQPGF